jgi:hypothetical protein
LEVGDLDLELPGDRPRGLDEGGLSGLDAGDGRAAIGRRLPLAAYDAHVPPTHCVACKDSAIDAATRDPQRSHRAIAREFTISEAAVRRHRTNHVDGRSVPTDTTPSAAAAARVGRPTKRTPRVEADLVAALNAGNTRQAACRYAGIDLHTFGRWLNYASFASVIEKAEADAEVRNVAVIAKAAQDGTWQASAWWLERRRPLAYGRTWLNGPEPGFEPPPTVVTVVFDRPDENRLTLDVPAVGDDRER